MRRRIRVLIADDSAFMRKLLKRVIESEKEFEVVAEASNGEEAYQKYLRLRPDLVLLDVNMPGLDGLAAAKIILSNDPSAKIIIVSALGQEWAIEAAQRMGIKHYVLKPFKPKDLIEAVRKVLNE
ncbi:MAG: two-component system response regulator [Thermoprotei archaeon]|nr:MAG: two-component system response regulator [Thermoprotei archaeon]